MEKLMYLVWLEADSTRRDVADHLLGPVRDALLEAGPRAMTLDVWDTESDIPPPVPTPEGETPLHGLVSLWVDTVEDRAPFEEILASSVVRLAGYSVVESLYRDYGGNRWSAPRDVAGR